MGKNGIAALSLKTVIYGNTKLNIYCGKFRLAVVVGPNFKLFL